jgi:WD40 repeat protein
VTRLTQCHRGLFQLFGRSAVKVLLALILSLAWSQAAPASTWSATGSMASARQHHTATLLPNGKVLVAGGNDSTGAELYDLASGTWSATGSMASARQHLTATLLRNGKVLVAGGSSWIYDPDTGIWTAAGSISGFPEYGHTATLLPDGKVLVVGGYVGGFGTSNSAELYDPATGAWAATGSMAISRQYHTATLLPDGKVLVAGGIDNDD